MEEIIVISEKQLATVILESAQENKIIKSIEYKRNGAVEVTFYNAFQRKMYKM